MAKYIYAAVFTKENDEKFSVVFNDLEGCYTCGSTLEEAIQMAEDVLALTLYGYETDGRKIPEPTEISDIKVNENEFVKYIACDTLEYRKKYV